jgi:cbb3-type cytochrome oxidase subunit 3
MEKRRLWNVFFILLGAGILGSLIFSMIGSHENERNTLFRGNERMGSFHGRMMDYHGHSNFHHSFELLPLMFVFIILFLVVWFIYRRFKRHQTDFIGKGSFIGETIRETPQQSSFSNKADYLDEWEKNIKTEDKENGNF